MPTANNRKEIIANRLRELRNELNVPVTKIIKFVGIGDSTYRCHETAKREPNAATLALYADFFGVSVDYLIGYTNEKEGSLEEVISSKRLTWEGKEITRTQWDRLSELINNYMK